jgi:hypothetical protein
VHDSDGRAAGSAGAGAASTARTTVATVAGIVPIGEPSLPPTAPDASRPAARTNSAHTALASEPDPNARLGKLQVRSDAHQTKAPAAAISARRCCTRASAAAA